MTELTEYVLRAFEWADKFLRHATQRVVLLAYWSTFDTPLRNVSTTPLQTLYPVDNPEIATSAMTVWFLTSENYIKYYKLHISTIFHQISFIGALAQW